MGFKPKNRFQRYQAMFLDFRMFCIFEQKHLGENSAYHSFFCCYVIKEEGKCGNNWHHLDKLFCIVCLLVFFYWFLASTFFPRFPFEVFCQLFHQYWTHFGSHMVQFFFFDRVICLSQDKLMCISENLIF